LTAEIETTLVVWDSKLVEAGEALASARSELIAELTPALSAAYNQVAGAPATVDASYDAPWREIGLAEALLEARRDEIRRGVSLVGPHRDDLRLTLNGLPARTHASQGEQRSVSLALRLSAHRVVTEATGSAPILLLDDVFSELDPDRSAALLEHLPAGQTILSSAAGLPPGASPEMVLRVEHGAIHAD
jgi:DNA replication and repair protein RecF